MNSGDFELKNELSAVIKKLRLQLEFSPETAQAIIAERVEDEKQHIASFRLKMEQAFQSMLAKREKTILERIDYCASQRMNVIEKLAANRDALRAPLELIDETMLSQLSLKELTSVSSSFVSLTEAVEDFEQRKNVLVESQLHVDETKLVPEDFVQKIGNLDLENVVKWIDSSPTTTCLASPIPVAPIDALLDEQKLKTILIRIGGAAVKNGDIVKLKELFATHFSTPASRKLALTVSVDKMCRNPILLCAAYFGHLAIVKYLVEEVGADILVRSGEFGKTVAHQASERGSIDVLRYCLSRAPALRDAVSWTGRAPLYSAVISGSLGNVIFLVDEAKANANCTDIDRRTPLYGAAVNNNLEIVKFLISRGADANCLDVKKDSPLHVAARNGSFEVVKFLANLHPELVQARNRFGDSASVKAKFGGFNEIAEWLDAFASRAHLLSSLDYSHDGQPLLHYAAYNGQNKEIDGLISGQKVNINIRNPEERTALISAVLGGRVNTVDFLIELGADVNAQDFQGATALQIAANMGNQRIVKLLLGHPQIDVNIRDIRGRNALHRSIDCKNTNVGVVEMLLEHGCDASQKDSNGDTPHRMAARKGSASILPILLKPFNNSIASSGNTR